MLNPRKLAAIDLVLLGPIVIITEFVAGAFLSIALGVYILVRGHGALSQIALGLYLISLGVNYIPMLIYAVAISNGESASKELGSELNGISTAMARYRRQSLWLLVPLVIPLLSFRSARKSLVD